MPGALEILAGIAAQQDIPSTCQTVQKTGVSIGMQFL